MATETRYHYLASYMPFYLFFTRSLHLVSLTANHEAEEKRKKKIPINRRTDLILK